MNQQELEHWYDQFGDSHDLLREQLLSQTYGLLPKPKNREPRRSRKLVSIAATLLLACVGSTILLSLSSRPAYAFHDVLTRIRSADRLYLRGFTRSARTGTDQPVEFYFSKPGTYVQTLSHSVRDESGEVTVVHEQIGSNGQLRYRQRVGEVPEVFDDLPIWSQIEMENRVVSLIGGYLHFDSADGFKSLGRRPFAGQSCDAYERKSHERDFVHQIYVVPSTGEPAGAVGLIRSEATGDETLVWKIDDVRLDRDAVEPAQFDKLRLDRRVPPSAPIDRFEGSVLHSEGPAIHVPFCLRMGDSLLACWTVQDTKPNSDIRMTATAPSFDCVSADGQTIASHVEPLGQTNDGTSEWDWVIVHPAATTAAWIEAKYLLTTETGDGRKTGLVSRRLAAVDIGDVGIDKVLQVMSASSGSISIESIKELYGTIHNVRPRSEHGQRPSRGEVGSPQG